MTDRKTYLISIQLVCIILHHSFVFFLSLFFLSSVLCFSLLHLIFRFYIKDILNLRAMSASEYSLIQLVNCGVSSQFAETPVRCRNLLYSSSVVDMVVLLLVLGTN